jgi:hypothetical protein
MESQPRMAMTAIFILDVHLLMTSVSDAQRILL